MGVIYVLVGLLGVVAPNGLGLLPLGGFDIFLHLGTGIVRLALGFMGSAPDRAEPARV